MNDEIPFPHLIPLNTKLNEYKGFINVLGKEYPVEIRTIENDNKSNNNNNNNNKNNTNNGIFFEELEFNCTKELYDILHPYSQTIKNRFLQCKNLNQFLYELKDIIDRLSKQTSTIGKAPIIVSNKPSLPINVLYLVLKELDDIGWDKIVEIDKNTFSTFEILLLDIKNREYSIEFAINENYPSQLPLIRCDLPIDNLELVNRIQNHNQQLLLEEKHKQKQDEIKNKYSIINILKLIEIMINEYQEFFDVMDDIDSNSWVLEPENPKRSSTYRRIALGNGCSLCFEVSPQQPRSFPSNHNFLGPAKKVSNLKNLLNQNLNEWRAQKEDNRSPVDNFQTILNLEFPLKQNTKIEEIVIECAICYTHRFFHAPTDDQDIKDTGNYSLPDIVCNNLKCQKHFHHTCIYEWLKALPNPRYSFSTIFGKCPYCSDPISVTAQQQPQQPH
ncbi:hypothetical protein DICPUDRAFT_151143 [Dictyostelium purpureum]|uniref:RING-type domain-containing protein n=1 Tax=Dictyostelium purpureum TaxID=5786 RepID=F0ZI36_DICPU|nr:uncharacterized protein DICPUDRAFT_151143 [Dictyostelium purpureum]EGC36390.1 hypothetical protein DICPUDRAFT_151143 [Dictyostelium purpureum]|eukprot:XP_003287087.1 hypothetical protein DICPUDRAFT_151143 [Dictyostelium purpureum]